MFTIINTEEMSAYPFGSDMATLKAAGVVVMAIAGVAETEGGKLTAEPKVNVPMLCQPLLIDTWYVTFPKITLAPVNEEEKLISTEREIP